MSRLKVVIPPDVVLLKLISQGICLEARDKNGSTALIKAAFNGCPDPIKALLAAGANVNAQGNQGYTALIWEARSGRTDNVKTLLSAGANIEAQDRGDHTALIWAAYGGHTETVKTLLEAGADIEVKQNKGYTALMWAAHFGRVETASALLTTGANLWTQDNKGNTALELTSNNKIKTLLRNAAKHESNADFIENGTTPKSAAEVYHLLAVTPLTDLHTPVDYAGNIRKIFAHARWTDKEQAAEVLSQMQDNGRINAETVDSILHATFPERLHTMRLQPCVQGMAL